GLVPCYFGGLPMRIGFFSALAFLAGSGLAVAQPPASPPMMGRPGPAPTIVSSAPGLAGNGYGAPPVAGYGAPPVNSYGAPPANGATLPPFSSGTCGQPGG